MKGRHALLALATLAAFHADALTPPGDSDGPVKLLSCVVSDAGILEAEVDSQSDDAMLCSFRCNYEFGGKPLFRWFNATVPARFHGRVGRFDTSGGRAGNFHGEVGKCEKTDAHAATR
ncbi:MAG TPA: hypothetical protein VFL16_14035 [Steroidobacteraceae bacterium]|nr:hypothetical protein [Steroidobacteraceae bacterium]